MQNSLPKSGAKILVVDDRTDNLTSIEAILEKDNYTIVKADSGKAALKILLNDHDFSLILMDVRMPDLSGYETATIIYLSLIHISEPTRLLSISYAVFCLKKKK